jgi:hypothetical protein
VFGQPYGIERQTVDGLARAICQQDSLPTWPEQLVEWSVNNRKEYELLKTKKMKNAKLSLIFVDSLMWSKKQKWSYEPRQNECIHATEGQRPTQRVVVVGQHIGECIGDIMASDDQLRLAGLVTQLMRRVR